ncbi:MAG TPA: hypothetical protein VD902_06395 [Symbiobacteriaceae bacterium]|nr:hypothetical protein [Symbiobacteriaceae bacterium]
MQDWGQLGLIALGFGLASAFISMKIVAADPKFAGAAGVIGFGISAFSLLFLQFGVKIPVSHHITLIAALAATTSGNLWVGAVFGILSAFVGEIASRLFFIHGDTHIDPPAWAIWPMTLVVLVLAKLGIM